MCNALSQCWLIERSCMNAHAVAVMALTERIETLLMP